MIKKFKKMWHIMFGKNLIQRETSGWLNLYPEQLTSSMLFNSRKEADQEAHEARLGEAQYISHKY